MWEPRRLKTLSASTVCYRDSFAFYLYWGNVRKSCTLFCLPDCWLEIFPWFSSISMQVLRFPNLSCYWVLFMQPSELNSSKLSISVVKDTIFFLNYKNYHQSRKLEFRGPCLKPPLLAIKVFTFTLPLK
jgi:hypothetical protein